MNKNKILYNSLKKEISEDYDMFEYFGVYSNNMSTGVKVMIIIKEEYCKTRKKHERMIQFNIDDDKISYLECKELDVKKNIYNKYKDKINDLLKDFYNDIYFEVIQCDTIIKNMNLIININQLDLRLEKDISINCNFSNCILEENPYDKFNIKIDNKKINKKISKGIYTTEDLLKKLKIKKSKLPEKVIIELEKSKQKNLMEEENPKKFAKKKKMW